MKHLYLLRHAKSSWDDPSMADFDRPLNRRGLKAAPFMGKLMAGKNFRPDVIMSSPAKRAIRTAILVKENSGFICNLIHDERIYEASPLTLRVVATELSDAFASALLVGHNPGMEGFVRYLTNHSEPMPTAALAVIDLSIDSWSDLTGACGLLTAVYRPREEMGRDNDRPS